MFAVLLRICYTRDTRLLDIDGHKRDPRPIPKPKENLLIRKATLLVIAIYTLTFCAFVAKASAVPDDAPDRGFIALAPLTIKTADRIKTPEKTVVFRHGDISWLPKLAAQAGWEPKHFKKLGQIILRESGGCPNRIGSSIVDKNCNVTGYTKATNKSDTGLLQINGVNYNPERNKWAIACKKMNICTQEPLLDPITNLKVGKLLFDEARWEPWNVCNWNPKAKGCK